MLYRCSHSKLLVKLVLLSVQKEMKIFLAKIVNLMKEENLFASQGGPIILAQVAYSYLVASLNTNISLVNGFRLQKLIHVYLNVLTSEFWDLHCLTIIFCRESVEALFPSNKTF